MKFYVEIAQIISVLLAALTFLWGVKAWKKEFVGKRRIELIEEVLALFYEVKDAIRDIRNPFQFEGEGKTRIRDENETIEQTALLDKMFVFYERVRKYTALFARLGSIRYRAMATFDKDINDQFAAFHKAISLIQESNMAITEYYQNQISLPKEHRSNTYNEELEYHKRQIWHFGDNDDISKMINNAIENIENRAEACSRKYNARYKISRLFQGLKNKIMGITS